MINFSKRTRIKSKCFNDIYFKFEKDEEGRIIISKKSTIKEIFKVQKSNSYLPKLSIKMKKGDATGLFMGLDKLETILEIDTSEVVIMNSFFKGCKSLQQIPYGFTTDKVTTLEDAFMGCKSIEELPKEMNTKKVVNMSRMCYDCGVLNYIPQIDTSNVTNLYAAFERCERLEKIPSLDTRKVKDMRMLCFRCYSLTTIGDFSTKSLKPGNAEGMFYRCLKLNNPIKKRINEDSKLEGAFSNVK